MVLHRVFFSIRFVAHVLLIVVSSHHVSSGQFGKANICSTALHVERGGTFQTLHEQGMLTCLPSKFTEVQRTLELIVLVGVEQAPVLILGQAGQVVVSWARSSVTFDHLEK